MSARNELAQWVDDYDTDRARVNDYYRGMSVDLARRVLAEMSQMKTALDHVAENGDDGWEAVYGLGYDHGMERVQNTDLAKACNVIDQVRELHERISAADDANNRWNQGVRESPTAIITHEMRDALARILADAEGSGQ